MLTLLSFNKNQSRNVEFNDLSYIDVDFKFISKDSVNKLLTQSKLFSNKSVPDPYYGGDDGFEDVYQMLDQACEMIEKKYL